jgi:hypothetical protein
MPSALLLGYRDRSEDRMDKREECDTNTEEAAKEIKEYRNGRTRIRELFSIKEWQEVRGVE